VHLPLFLIQNPHFVTSSLVFPAMPPARTRSSQSLGSNYGEEAGFEALDGLLDFPQGGRPASGEKRKSIRSNSGANLLKNPSMDTDPQYADNLQFNDDVRASSFPSSEDPPPDRPLCVPVPAKSCRARGVGCVGQGCGVCGVRMCVCAFQRYFGEERCGVA
jgi:hypothetical protein